jgi:hypothetical protein
MRKTGYRTKNHQHKQNKESTLTYKDKEKSIIKLKSRKRKQDEAAKVNLGDVTYQKDLKPNNPRYNLDSSTFTNVINKYTNMNAEGHQINEHSDFVDVQDFGKSESYECSIDDTGSRNEIPRLCSTKSMKNLRSHNKISSFRCDKKRRK